MALGGRLVEGIRSRVTVVGDVTVDESTGGTGPALVRLGGGPGSGVGTVQPTTFRAAPSTVAAAREMVRSRSASPGAVRPRPARERLVAPALHPHLDLEPQPRASRSRTRPSRRWRGIRAGSRAGLARIGLGPLYRPEDAAVRLEVLPHEPVGAPTGHRRSVTAVSPGSGRRRRGGKAGHDVGHPAGLTSLLPGSAVIRTTSAMCSGSQAMIERTLPVPVSVHSGSPGLPPVPPRAIRRRGATAGSPRQSRRHCPAAWRCRCPAGWSRHPRPGRRSQARRIRSTDSRAARPPRASRGSPRRS